MSNQIKVTKNGKFVVIDNGLTTMIVDSGDLFGLIKDLLVVTNCHHILLTAVKVAKDECSQKRLE